MSNKRQLMESTYQPGMDAETLVTAVAEQHGVDVSTSYARQFLSLHRDATAVTVAEVARADWELDLLRESVSRLEQALLAPGWRMLTMQGRDDFTREGLRTITELARIMRLKNPLIMRGVDVLALYVWAQGVSVRAKDDLLNDVVQAFLDDERNRAELSAQQARRQKEVDIETEGNLFFRFFTNAQTGRVRMRTVPFDEIDDVLCNPEDAKEPWFYRRVWTQQALNGATEQHEAYYPDLRFTPRNPASVEALLPPGAAVDWSTPIYHVKINLLHSTAKFGTSRVYPALDWALAYKSFLEQLASVWQALARWAAKLTVKGGARGVAAAKTTLNTTLSATAVTSADTNPPPTTGSMFIQSEGTDLQPFRTAGATMSAEDGRRLLLMSIMAFGFPETFYGDVSVGTLATAQSLDRPSELRVIDRQSLWRDVYTTILNYVLLQAVKAPAGPLRGVGTYRKEDDGGEWREWVEWPDGVDPTIVVDFPPIREDDVPGLVGAIADATTLKGSSAAGALPLETAVSQFLRVLNVAEPDEVMDLWRQEQAERQARADQMAAQMAGDGSPRRAADEQDATAEAYRRMLAEMGSLVEALRESENDEEGDHESN